MSDRHDREQVEDVRRGQMAVRLYWQALRLYLKGAPFHPHPRKREPATEAPC